MFDSEALDGETLEEFNERRLWAAHHCEACPARSACTTNMALTQQPYGFRPGHHPHYRKRNTQ